MPDTDTRRPPNVSAGGQVWDVLEVAVRRERVRSSVLTSVGYDQKAGVLEVEFAGGRVYRYFVVPAAVYRELMAAGSLGRYFNEFVRDKYPVREVE